MYGVSELSGEVWMYDMDGVLQRKIVINDCSKNIEIRDSTGAKILEVESHGDRHAYGGADAIPVEGLRFSQLAKVLGTEATVVVAAGDSAVVPKGVYIVAQSSTVRVEYSPDGGTTWRIIYPEGVGGLIISDGENVRFSNSGTSDETMYLIPIL